jgi:hypothetical protein
MQIQELRKKYPRFVYESFDYKITGNDLKIVFCFGIEPDINFKPKLVIKKINKKRLRQILRKQVLRLNLDNLIFNLGLMEIPTYWKATCSPEIVVKAGPLNNEQIKWWRNLIIKGLGQFFYENKIDWRPSTFLKIRTCHRQNLDFSLCSKFTTDPANLTRQGLVKFDGKLRNGYLVPFSGGRDSIVTLESLKKSADWRSKTALFLVNPNGQIKKAAKVSRVKKQIIVKRVIDKRLLELNKKGYLNGHTPFTALLSFLSVFCAALFNYKNIAFSNEKSANEGNVKYLGKIINHQWAKSSEFEKIFKDYCKKYLVKNINYFSYLRKYGELKISKMFTKYPQYFSSFSSCNASMKIGAKQTRWCGSCPKCLFVYLTLYPFLEKKELLKIFGKAELSSSKDIFNNRKLLPTMKALIGQGSIKPFECVGTKKESQMAFKLSFKKAKKLGRIPYLLTKC